jgi:hypothetical protein
MRAEQARLRVFLWLIVFQRHCEAAIWRCKGCYIERGRIIDLRRDLAEREGFEPSIRFKPYNALAGRPLRPLGHLSAGFVAGNSTAFNGPG